MSEVTVPQTVRFRGKVEEPSHFEKWVLTKDEWKEVEAAIAAQSAVKVAILPAKDGAFWFEGFQFTLEGAIDALNRKIEAAR